MPKVPLKVIANSNRIEAPDFCPYYEQEIPQGTITKRTISPVICSVCKICTFIPSIDTPLEFNAQEKEKCKEYLTSFNSQLSKIITKQISFLLHKERSPLAILITANVLQNMLDFSVTDKARKDVLFHHFIDVESVICNIHGCPIYFSRKLTLSAIQVVGETEWK